MMERVPPWCVVEEGVRLGSAYPHSAIHFLQPTTSVVLHAAVWQTRVCVFVWLGVCVCERERERIQLQISLNTSAQHIHAMQINTQKSHGYECFVMPSPAHRTILPLPQSKSLTSHSFLHAKLVFSMIQFLTRRVPLVDPARWRTPLAAPEHQVWLSPFQQWQVPLDLLV